MKTKMQRTIEAEKTIRIQDYFSLKKMYTIISIKLFYAEHLAETYTFLIVYGILFLYIDRFFYHI